MTVGGAPANPRAPAPGSPTLTTRGWGVLAAGAALLVAARLFGSAELAGLGAAAGAAVAVAAVLVGRGPLTYRAERRLSPARVGVGETATAILRFTNTGPRPTPAQCRSSSTAHRRAAGSSTYGANR